MKWKNDSLETCPPWGTFVITRTEVDGLDVIFHGIKNTADIPPLSSVGVPWNAGFNSGRAVEAGGEGFFTVDFPTWCLIDTADAGLSDGFSGDANSILSFKTYVPGSTEKPWGLSQIRSTGESDISVDSHLWTGYRVFATQYIPEFNRLFSETIFQQFRIGLVGGLVTYLKGES